MHRTLERLRPPAAALAQSPVGLIALLTALHYLLVISQLAGARTGAISSLLFLPIELLTAQICWRAAGAEGLLPHQQLAWRLFAGAVGANMLADAIWFLLESVLRIAPFPSPADILYGLCYLTLVPAVLLLPRSLSLLRNPTLWLDILTLLIGGMVVVVLLAGGGGPQRFTSNELVDLTISVIYPLVSFLSLFAAVAVAISRAHGADRRVVGLVVGGLGATFTSNVLYMLVLVGGTYASGSWVDGLSSTGMLLLGAAAFVQRARPPLRAPPPPPAQQTWHSLAPYAASAAALALLGLLSTIDTAGQRLLIVAASSMTFLIIVRQLLTVRQHARQAAASAQQRAEQLYATLVERLPGMVFTQSPEPPYPILTASPQARAIFGRGPEELLGAPEQTWWPHVLPEDRPALIEAASQADREGRPFAHEYRISRPGGAVAWLREEAILVRGLRGEPLLWQGIVLDISDQRAMQDQLAHRATHDALTELANRELLLARIAEAAARDRALALLFLDLDQFKQVNDQHGHATGDALLVAVAGRLRACVRPGDTVARLGGDEFVVLVAGERAAQDAQPIAERILGALGAPFQIQGHALQVSASIGLARSQAPHRAGAELLDAADAAMYASKSGGGARISAAPEPQTAPARHHAPPR